MHFQKRHTSAQTLLHENTFSFDVLKGYPVAELVVAIIRTRS